MTRWTRTRWLLTAAAAVYSASWFLRRWFSGRAALFCAKGSVTFEDPTPGASFVLGTTYKSPAQIYNSGDGLSANIGELTSSSGGKSFGHGEIVGNPPHPFGTGQMIRLNNTVLVFDLKRYTRKAEFEYLDQGGFINLGARSAANMYVGSMYALPAAMAINGVQVSKSNVREFFNPQGVKVAERGRITLRYSPDIGGMTIGGQELSLDNFCFE